jgi:ribonuclease R
MPLDQIAEICTHISETEANAAAAERRTIDRFAAALFEARLGAVVDGVIVAITGFGAFIRLEDGAADGLLPLNGFPDDFYDYDEAAQSLEGRHNGWRFVMGLSLRVKVTEVTPVSGGILLEWVEGGLQSETSAANQQNTQKNMVPTDRGAVPEQSRQWPQCLRAWQRVETKKTMICA